MAALRVSLRQLQVFAAVARTGSTAAASVAVALSQSATSSAVNELERLLDVRLFDRAGKRLQLNDLGRVVLRRALSVLDGATGVEQLAREGASQLQALRIGASTTIGSYVLPKLLASYFAAGSGPDSGAWQSRVSIANTAEICSAVARFELDVGIIEGPNHEPELKVEPWLNDEMTIVAAADDPISGRDEVVSARALRGATWLLREPGSGTRAFTDQMVLPLLHSYRRSIELGNSEAIKRAAAEGLGVACLSHWVVADMVHAGHLRLLRTRIQQRIRRCYIVRHHAKEMTPALQALLSVLTAAKEVGRSV